MTWTSDSEVKRGLTMASALHSALHQDAFGGDSPWDSSAFDFFRQDAQAAAMLRDARNQLKGGGLRFDDSTAVGGYLPEALTMYDPEVVEEEYEDTKYADPAGFLNIRNVNRPGVRNIKVQSVNRVGRFRVSGDRATQTEALDAGMRDTDYQAKYIEAHIEYTSRELDAMAEAQRSQDVFGFMNMVTYKMKNVVEAAYREESNRINASGIPSMGIYGMHNFYGLPRMSSTLTLTENSTPEEFIAVFDRAKRAFLVNTGEKYQATDVMMTSDLLETMSGRLIGTSGSLSVLDWLMQKKGIKSVWTTPQMRTENASGPFLHFFRRSADSQVIVTKGLTQRAMPYQSGGVTRVDYEAATAGFISKKPFEHLIVENVGL